MSRALSRELPCTGRPELPGVRRGLPWRAAIAAAVLLVSSAALGRPEDAVSAQAGLQALEALGDAEWRVAVASYEEAVRSWEQVASGAARLGDRQLDDRSVRARAALAVFLRAPALVDLLSKTETGFPAPGPLPAELKLLVPARPAAGEPSTASLEKLSKLLAAAERQLAKLPGQDERDLLLLEEMQALTHRILADQRQRQADSSYLQALDRVRAEAEDPRRLALKVRLLFKLRDLEPAWKAAREGEKTLRGLPPAEYVEHLKVLHTLARLRGDELSAGRIRVELLGLGAKADERASPSARFSSLLFGSRVDLLETAQTLLSALASFSLPPRESALVACFTGLCALELGELALAEEVLRSPAAAADDDPWLSASVAARLGQARLELGDYEAALDSLRRAASKLGDARGAAAFKARVGLNASRTLLSLGQLEAAKEEALEVMKTGGLPRDLALRARILLGSVLYEKARSSRPHLADARSAFAKASLELEAARKAGEAIEGGVELEVTLAINQANLLRFEVLDLSPAEAALRRREAVELQDKALRVAHAAGLHQLAAVASGNLGELHLESGDLPAAKSFVDWAMGRASELRLQETQWRCHWYKGRIAEAEKNAPAADSEYAKAESIIESYRSRILSAEAKSGFLNDKLAFYRDLVRRRIESGRADLALEAAERAKARALVDSLGWRFLVLSDSRQTELYRQFVSLVSLSETARTGTSGSFLSLRAKDLDYAALRSKLTELKSRIEAEVPSGQRLRALIDGDPLDSAAILRHIPAGTALVEYFSLGLSHVALVAQEGRVEAFALPVSPAELARAVTAFVQGGAADEALARRLHSWLLEPIEKSLRGSRLVIVPQDALHQLPFEALRDSRGYVVARWDVVYLPSASILGYINGPARPSGQVRKLLAMVDPDTDYNHDGKPDMPPLPFAREEVAAFARSFPEKDVLTGPAARKEACFQRASQYDVIHYACHGEFYPSRPWDSSLYLAPGEARAGDGRLKASEVYALDLRQSRLVALSGCETGRSQVFPGDDTVSIASAFLHSGASSLLVSLWKVEDQATSSLMKSFYGKWLEQGKDKARALREAKMELLTGSFPKPHQWAAFVLVGEP